MKKILLFAGLAALLWSCNHVERSQRTGETASEVATGERTFDLSGFKELDISSAMEVELTQSDQYQLRFEGDEELLKHLKVKLKGQELEIGTTRKMNFGNHSVKVYISAPEYRKIDLSGACVLKSTNTLKGTSPLNLDMSGASSLNLDVAVPAFQLEASGASNVVLRGTASKLDIDGSGAGEINAKELKADDVHIELSGVGSASVWAVNSLHVEVSGVASVVYKGNPTHISKDVSGTASLHALK